MKNHELNQNASACGTSLQGEIELNCQKLIALFGVPNESDGCKVSTEWVFESETGEVFTLYDYKETNLYDDGLPTVEEFRALPSYSWHIGALRSDDVESFKEWLNFKVTNQSEIERVKLAYNNQLAKG